MMDNNRIPLGISQVYDKDQEKTFISWSYLEDADIEYFEIQYFDENERKWKPYDGRNGIIKKR